MPWRHSFDQLSMLRHICIETFCFIHVPSISGTRVTRQSLVALGMFFPNIQTIKLLDVRKFSLSSSKIDIVYELTTEEIVRQYGSLNDFEVSVGNMVRDVWPKVKIDFQQVETIGQACL
jgi:hypothetical protein